ncbi:MAG: glycosyltransferase [Alphaproteobacteria bacterium]|nr:glycosyltransferase [Alphaproteobacteria bacterium]
MPCLNEIETIETCIKKAMTYLEKSGVKGEVLIADNGSTDGSQATAEKLGARVVAIADKGYGAALRGGIAAARGKYVIMGDSDDSYDFLNLDPFVEKLREGYDLVMGNRFQGGIMPGAMPPLHRYLGNPVLSFFGRLFFSIPIGDFHCGLRGFDRAAILSLGLQTQGMEFASEMVVRASLARLKMAEVPTVLSKDGRSHPPHLRSWRDGWRHLRFLLLFSPTWLYIIPAAVLLAGGAAILFMSYLYSFSAHPTFGENWIFLGTAMIQIAHLAGVLGFGARFYTLRKKLRESTDFDRKMLGVLNFNWMVLSGLALAVTGLFVLIGVLASWIHHDYARPASVLPTAVGILFCVIGLQNFFGGFVYAMIADFDAELRSLKNNTELRAPKDEAGKAA